MGCYPLFCCEDWSALPADLAAEGSRWVSLVLVTDPFAPVNRTVLSSGFGSVRPFKQHFVVDLARPAMQRSTRRHRRSAARSVKQGVVVERCDEPERAADEVIALYEVLARRHGLTGLKAYSPTSLRAQLAVPGAVLFQARRAGTTLSAQLWYLHGNAAYMHLMASSEEGYRLSAAFAVASTALQALSDEVPVALLGGGAGADESASPGLVEFKAGWATGTRTAYLCGRIFDRSAYEQLVRRSPRADAGYFPRYRAGELL
jgi:hypothetical protein